MGSSGSGRFSDYPGSDPKPGSGQGSGQGGGSPPQDRCGIGFSVVLEDVEQSDYFVANQSPPAKGTQLTIAHKKRLIALDPNGQSVGQIPTSHNYLGACLAAGWTYTGVVGAISAGPVIRLTVDFAATKP